VLSYSSQAATTLADKFAQQTLTGTILDDTGMPLPGASVMQVTTLMVPLQILTEILN